MGFVRSWGSVVGVVFFALAAGLAFPTQAGQSSQETTAIVGATIIDGNGGEPIRDGTVLVVGNRISAVGPRSAVAVPTDARVIDGSGKYVTPGFIDTNVHISLYGGGRKERKETAVFYRERGADLTLEAAQMQLRYGITTVRDSYGALLPLMEVRDKIARGEAIGPRMYVAGNIVGWGGPYSMSFARIGEEDLSIYEEEFTTYIAQGSGEELMDMYPDELRVAINDYLDKGPDFIKYGGTSHWSFPTFIGFSPLAQEIIVEETQERGLVAETHATNPEGLRLAIEAGIDLIQHPEVLADREMSDELVAEIRDRGIICSMLVNTFTGEAWQKHLRDKEAAERRLAEQESLAQEFGLKRVVPREETPIQRRRKLRELGFGMEMRRTNATKLIEGGCIVTLGTDNYAGAAPEFGRVQKPIWQEPGIGTLMAIEGLVELGMTPSEAIVAATKNGALACRALEEFGTLEEGKIADLLVLDADPLEDISNIRRQSVIMREGRVVDPDALPTDPVFYRRAAELSTERGW